MYVHVLALDPGLRSGWAKWTAPHDGKPAEFSAGIADPHDFMDIILRWTNEHASETSHRTALLVCEGFIINSETHKKDQGSMQWPIELRGVARFLCLVNNIAFDTQLPSEAKNFADDAKLKRFGMHTPGREDHARDASRHLLLALLGRTIHPNLKGQV